MLPPMRYKTFTFPHNPRVYSITYRRDVAVQKVPMGIFSIQDLGRTCRILKGEGEFYGPKAYDTFKELATVFYENGPGALYHPIWQSSRAYFTGLSLRQEPREDYVAYSFEFQEGFFSYAPIQRVVNTITSGTGGAGTSGAAAAAQAGAAAETYTVQPGDTLWAIATARGMTLSELLALNPGISNPNLIRAGEKVRVC